MKKILLVLGLTLTFSFLLAKPEPAVATGDATGSLSGCRNAKGYAGGVKLYAGENQTGDYRIMCVDDPNSYWYIWKTSWDNHLNFESDLFGSSKYDDTWGNFNNKTQSIKLRANTGCRVDFTFFKKPNRQDKIGNTKTVDRRWDNSQEIINVNISEANETISSFELESNCSIPLN